VNRDQWKREQSVRWQSDRRAAYSRFLAACDAYERAVFDLQQDERLMADPESVPRDALDGLYRKLQAAKTEITLMGSARVCFSAQRLAGALVPSFMELMRDHDRGPNGWSNVDFSLDLPGGKTITEVRFRFVQEARKELGLREDHGIVAASLPSHIR
jgi:hypothetical protein